MQTVLRERCIEEGEEECSFQAGPTGGRRCRKVRSMKTKTRDAALGCEGVVSCGVGEEKNCVSTMF